MNKPDTEQALDWLEQFDYFEKDPRHTIVNTIRQALAERDAMGWRDIETAPDGRSVLTVTKDIMFDAFFEPCVTFREGEYWFNEAGRRISRPSYWKPLDPPPTLEKHEDVSGD